MKGIKMLLRDLRKEDYEANGDEYFFGLQAHIESLIVYAVRHYHDNVLSLLNHQNQVFEAASTFAQNILNVKNEKWQDLRVSAQQIKGYHCIGRGKDELIAYMKIDEKTKLEDLIRILIKIYNQKPLNPIENVKKELD